MLYDYRSKRSVALLDPTLDQAVALNVVGHLSTSIAAAVGGEIIGRSVLTDADGGSHLGVARHPLIVKIARRSKIKIAISQGHKLPDVIVADYPEEVLDSGHDDELSMAIANKTGDELVYLGAMFFGPTEAVDRICRQFSLWPKVRQKQAGKTLA